MSAGESTGIGARGPYGRRRRRTAASSPAPAVIRKLPSVGRKAHLWYDPVTGRRLPKQVAK